jgi:hypothetical protein
MVRMRTGRIGSRSKIRITAKKRAGEIYSGKPGDLTAFQSSGHKEEKFAAQ